MANKNDEVAKDSNSQTDSLISSGSNNEIRRRTAASLANLETVHNKTMQHIQRDCAATSGTPTIHKVKGVDEMSTSGAPEEWFEKHSQNMRDTLSRRSCHDWISALLPMYSFSWLQTYSWRNNLLTDVIAGLTVGVMIIPQSMSYAKLAGLPVEFGLYSSLVPIYAYALFGSSRQLIGCRTCIIGQLIVEHRG